MVAKKAQAYADTTQEVVVTAKDLTEEASAKAEAEKKTTKDSLSALWAKHAELEADMSCSHNALKVELRVLKTVGPPL